MRMRPRRRVNVARALIIVRRDSSAERENPAFAEALGGYGDPVGGGRPPDRLCGGLWRLSLSSRCR